MRCIYKVPAPVEEWSSPLRWVLRLQQNPGKPVLKKITNCRCFFRAVMTLKACLSLSRHRGFFCPRAKVSWITPWEMGGLFHSKVRLCPLGYVYALTVASVKLKNCFLFLFFFKKISETCKYEKSGASFLYLLLIIYLIYFLYSTKIREIIFSPRNPALHLMLQLDFWI